MKPKTLRKITKDGFNTHKKNCLHVQGYKTLVEVKPEYVTFNVKNPTSSNICVVLLAS